MDNICRTCLRTFENLNPLFGHDQLVLKLEEIASMQMVHTETMPSKVCTSCEDDIENFYEFRKKVITNEKYLKEKFKVSLIPQVKQEIIIVLPPVTIKDENYEDHLEDPFSCNNEDISNSINIKETSNNNDLDSNSMSNTNTNPKDISKVNTLLFDKTDYQVTLNSKELLVYACKLCDFTTDNSTRIGQHNLKHKPTTPCPKCGKFLGMHRLNRHVKLCKAEPKTSLNSDYNSGFNASSITNSTFTNSDKTNLTTHYNSTNLKGKLSCNRCGYQTDSRRNLLNHKRNHNPGQQCRHCLKTVRPQSMSRHLKTHNITPKIPRRQCPLCLKMCTVAFGRHMEMHKKLNHIPECTPLDKTGEEGGIDEEANSEEQSELVEIKLFEQVNVSKRVNYEEVGIEEVYVEDVIVDDAGVKEVNIGEVNVKDINVDDINFKFVNVEGVNVKDVNVGDINVQYVNIKDVNVKDVNGKYVNGKGINVKDVNVKDVNDKYATVQHVNVKVVDVFDDIKAFSVSEEENNVQKLHFSEEPKILEATFLDEDITSITEDPILITSQITTDTFSCLQCNFKTTRKENMRIHNRTHEPRRECPICGKYLTRYSLHKHIQSHKDPSNSTQSTLNKIKVYREEAVEYPDGTQVYACKQCPYTNSRYVNFKRHKYVHMPMKECHICFRKMNPFHLPKHLKKHQMIDDVLYSCDKCNLRTNNKKKYKSHIKSHLPKTACKVCGKLVGHTYLSKHQLIHKDEPVVCPICGKVSKNDQSYQMHKKFHVEEDNTCEICGKTFTTKGAFRRHKNQHKSKSSPKSFKCGLCDKAFYTKEAINKHHQSHTGDRPHPCAICDKKLSSSYALKVHMRLHTKERPYECEHCSMAFPQVVSLRTHLKSKHNVVLPRLIKNFDS